MDLTFFPRSCTIVLQSPPSLGIQPQSGVSTCELFKSQQISKHLLRCCLRNLFIFIVVCQILATSWTKPWTLIELWWYNVIWSTQYNPSGVFIQVWTHQHTHTNTHTHTPTHTHTHSASTCCSEWSSDIDSWDGSSTTFLRYTNHLQQNWILNIAFKQWHASSSASRIVQSVWSQVSICTSRQVSFQPRHRILINKSMVHSDIRASDKEDKRK